MDLKEKLLDEIADAYAEIDDLVEEHEEAVQHRFAQLLNEQGERVPEVWDAGECPINVTLDDLMKVPVSNRGEKWELLGRRLIACAREQTWVEILSIPFLQVADKHAKRTEKAAKQLGSAGVRSVAKIGPGKQRFTEKRNERREKRIQRSA